ncbi:NAD(P)-binding domain-containing protein [Vibrio mediterranei]|uniref:NAD(P)-dependent oxidoreductase n=1 Tax=Vibrio mediterranei TaxID=689 RepID=UPI0038CE5B47
MNNIGFIGLGRMGQAICLKLLEHGILLYVNNRTKDKATILLDKGAKWSDSPDLLGKECNIIILCLSGEKVTEEVLSDSKKGILFNCNRETIIIDTGTISPSSAKNNYLIAKEHGVEYVSCPVSGGIEGATKGSLAAIVAAQPSARSKVEPIINLYADRITWLSSHSNAQKLKILNNLAESINLLGAFEVLSLGLEHDIPLNELHSVLTTCRGRSAYMDVALNFLNTDQQTSNVSLAVRCKDLELSSLLTDKYEQYIISDTARNLFNKVLEIYGNENDQCEYFNFIHQKNRI